jgi:acetyltransferase-like isoleucine patch superfamily enzyme
MLIEKPRLPLKAILLYGWWPSALKKLLYRATGYRIGRGVSLGFGSVVQGKDVELGDYVRLGFLSFIRSETVRIGAHVQIGAMTMIDTPHVEIGEGTRLNEQVFIGGLQFPDSKLIVGRNCQIMQMTFINPTRSITIGDDTGIGGHCLLFGHTSWLSKFEGYSVEFESIEIGSSANISWRVFLLPGSRIGDGAVIGANSLVKGTIPPRCLAVGFPARVVSYAGVFPAPVTDADKERFLDEIVAEMLSYIRASGFKCEIHQGTYEVTDQRKRRFGRRSGRRPWHLLVQGGGAQIRDPTMLPAGTSVFLSLHEIPEPMRAALCARRVMWIDIDKKERSDEGNDLGEEVVQYLRRYGVRFLRVKCRVAFHN